MGLSSVLSCRNAVEWPPCVRCVQRHLLHSWEAKPALTSSHATEQWDKRFETEGGLTSRDWFMMKWHRKKRGGFFSLISPTTDTNSLTERNLPLWLLEDQLSSVVTKTLCTLYALNLVAPNLDPRYTETELMLFQYLHFMSPIWFTSSHSYVILHSCNCFAVLISNSMQYLCFLKPFENISSSAKCHSLFSAAFSVRLQIPRSARFPLCITQEFVYHHQCHTHPPYFSIHYVMTHWCQSLMMQLRSQWEAP